MERLVTSRDLELHYSPGGIMHYTIKVPKGTEVISVVCPTEPAFAVADLKLVANQSNSHDAAHYYCFLPAEAVSMQGKETTK
jgi:hypothetical protein